MTPLNQVLETAKLAVETYFHGEMATKRKFSKDMTSLAAAIQNYESQQETVRLHKPDYRKSNGIDYNAQRKD